MRKVEKARAVVMQESARELIDRKGKKEGRKGNKMRERREKKRG